MAGSISIVVVENELAECQKLKSMLAGDPDIQVVGEARDGRECVDLVRREHPQIVLLKEDLPVLNGLSAAKEIAAEWPGIGIILMLHGNEGADVFKTMLQLGIKEYLTQPLVAETVLEEIHKMAGEQQRKIKVVPPPTVAEPEAPKRRVITVTGPRGGCGKTVIATNLAVAMAASRDKIALVDLNLWGGDIAMLLDMTPRRSLGDLLPGFGGIDYDVVDSVITKHSSGPSVLAAPLTGTFDGSTLSRYMVQSILEALREHYECAIIDTGYANLESTLAAMDYSDTILVVVGMDLPRLRDGKLYLRNLLAANYPKDKIRVVVNRASGSKEIPAGEIESILEFPVIAQLPNDESVGSSVNLGKPFVTNYSNRPLTREIQTLAANLMPASANGATKPKTKRWPFPFKRAEGGS